MTPSSKRPLIVLRHGFASDAYALESFAKYLNNLLPIPVNNESYDWRKSVLENGVDLAEMLVQKFPDYQLILIGHSMGGLVCRIANLAINCSEFFEIVKKNGEWLGFPKSILERVQRFAAIRDNSPLPSIAGLIALATPNSGAIRRSQTASLANLAGLLRGNPMAAVSGVTRLLFEGLNLRWESVKDLTGDRLFRLFSYLRVRAIPIYTISGSKGNVLTGNAVLGFGLKLGGINMSMPNDQVVEDSSVDLSKSVLPHEFDPTLCFHTRLYTDCIDVDHFAIYQTEVARSKTIEFVAQLVLQQMGAPAA